MLLHIKAAKLPAPVREYVFHPKRKWRFDFCWPDQKIALEVEGGIWGTSRHTTATGFIEDCNKYNEAQILGWRVIRVCESHIQRRRALEWVETMMGMIGALR